MQTSSEGTGGERRIGLSGHMKLCIIGIAIQIDTIAPKDATTREKINNEKEWS